MARTAAANKAAEMVGDGKLPNVYFVSCHSDWLTNVKDPKTSTYDWAGDCYSKDQMPPILEGQIRGPFTTFAKALDYAERIINEEVTGPEAGSTEAAVHGVTIEDRFTGTCWSAEYLERWRVKKYRGREYTEVTWSFERQDDTSYTKSAMEKLGAKFE